METMNILGLDLGQAADFSALCALQRKECLGPFLPQSRPNKYYACLGLKRWPLGTSYPNIVKEVEDLTKKAELQDAFLIVDASGVGRPVIDMLKEAHLPAKLKPVIITAGNSESFTNSYYHVAKQMLISNAQIVLQERRVRLPTNSSEITTLVRELENYRVKVTQAANETFNAREGEHDDLCLAFALCCWWGEKKLKKVWIR